MLRGYTRGDLDAMFRLDEACFEEPFRFTKRAMRRFAEARNAQVLLAVTAADGGEEVAGFSIVHVERRGAATLGYVLTLDVAPALRRCGLAKRLMEQVERDAEGAGCEAMLLHVFTGNAGAIALYEKLGYVRASVAENFYSKGVHAWMYRKQLR